MVGARVLGPHSLATREPGEVGRGLAGADPGDNHANFMHLRRSCLVVSDERAVRDPAGSHPRAESEHVDTTDSRPLQKDDPRSSTAHATQAQ